MLVLETMGLLAAFVLLIWLFTRKNRLDGLHWYPKRVQQIAVERGLAEHTAIAKRARLCKLLGLAVIAGIVLGSVFGLNHVRDWWTATRQIYGMLFVLNLFDAVVVDWF